MRTSAHSPAEIHALFRDAFNRGDVDALIVLYEPEAVLVVGGKNVCGRDNIRLALERMLQHRGRMTLETRDVIESPPGIALLRGSWVIERTEGPTTQGMSTEVIRKQPDGSWMFVIDSPYT